ncbi:MAG TPA: hypothetical protein VHB70_20710 [Parafilimonas sp.]|nr:hypothetical protein [Parafilimonas sp.]
MQKTFEKQIPAEKQQSPNIRKTDLQNPPKKEVKKEEFLNDVEASLAAAVADLIIQQNLS